MKKTMRSSSEIEKTDSRSVEPSQEEKPAAYTCSLGEDVRKIQQNAPSGGGCEVVYIKAEKRKIVADAKNDMNYCNKVVEKIQRNLSEAGFDCQRA